MDLDDFGVVADQGTQLATKCLPYLAHSPNRLEHRRLEIVGVAKLQHGPKTRLEQAAQGHRLRKSGPRARAAARITVETAPFAAVRALDESVILIESSPHAQRVEQNLLVFRRDLAVEQMTARCLRQQLGHVALIVGLDGAQPLRLAAEPSGAVKKGVMVDLHEGLERHSEPLAVAQHSLMV